MHDLPRQKLSELLAEHGPTLCDDAKKLEGLLKDVLRNEHRRETFVLVSALREGVAHELRNSTSGMPPAALAAKLVRQLCDTLGLDESVARWSVESWAVALGVGIALPPASPINPVSNVNTTRPTTATGAGVDLAALALQHRAKVDQGKAHAAQVQKQAKELAEQTRDFATAAQMIEVLEPQWRDAKLYKKICRDRDHVKRLEASIQDAVQKGRLRFLRGSVQELLKLQPERNDMRRLLDVLPEEPELDKEFTNSSGMRFVLIPPGEFVMGSHQAHDEKLPHLVRIARPFYLGVFPVTQAEYQSTTRHNPSRTAGNPSHPVEQVSWGDAVACAKKLSQRSAEMRHRLIYRLPSEAEWEYACRAGSTGKWCFGDDESQLENYAWFSGNSRQRTHPVGQKKPNAWGLYDMHGNVWEWCLDWYDVSYYQASPTDNPPGPPRGRYRASRGGSFYGDSSHCRAAFWLRFSSGVRRDDLGFRLAAVPE